MKYLLFVLTLSNGMIFTSAPYISNVAYACACCSNRGTYVKEQRDFRFDEKEEMANVKAKGELTLGFGAASSNTWVTEGKIENEVLTLKVSDGELTFSFKKPFKFLETDMLGQDDMLFKQVEIKGDIQTSSPELKKYIGNSILVITGSGNSCSFTPAQWILKPVKGSETAIYGYGKLTP